jgi:hypothetical protein
MTLATQKGEEMKLEVYKRKTTRVAWLIYELIKGEQTAPKGKQQGRRKVI